VVTHGTDALEEVAYFIDETVGLWRHSCSRSDATELGSGYDSLETSKMRCAWRLRYREYGTLVTMRRILRHGAIQSRYRALQAFTARRGAARGCIFGDQITLPWRPVSFAFRKNSPTLPPSVPILTLGVADDGLPLTSSSQ
jgi:hypothetical protein